MLLPLLLASIAPLQQSAAQSLVTVDLDAAGIEVGDLQRASFDVAFLRPDAPLVEVVADGPDLERLGELGIPFTIVHPDLAAFYGSRLDSAPTATASLGAFLSPPFGQGSMGGYYTFSELESVLDQITAAFPALSTDKFSIGQSLEGRELWAVKISDNPDVDEGEPEVRYDSLHHAREPQSLHTTLWFMLWLLENYGGDAAATYLVDGREMFFVPAVNPDGYVYNEQTNPSGGGLWRKNRRNNGNGTFGVDLNRNYSYQWGFDETGSSSNTSDETYRGPSAASEPEVQAMQAFLSSRSFVTALSTHSYSNLWLHPWGYDSSTPPNAAEYNELSILATIVNNYVYGPASTVLYLANGVTVDYDEGVHGTYSWTPEIGSSADGFWPPTNRIVPLAQENELAFARTAWAAGPFVLDNGTTLTEVGDGDGFFEAGEDVEVVLGVRNSGAAGATVDLTLSTSHPNASVAQGVAGLGSVASFSSTDNAGTPLVLSIAPATPAGTSIPYTISIQYDGYSEDVDGAIAVGQPRTLVSDDVELELGWIVGLPGDTATAGLWEHGDPVGTTYQGEPSNPENDATPAPGTLCFATGNGSTSAGGDDVDDGLTTLISPAFHLSAVSSAALSYSRWYANLGNPQDDEFQVSISDDDGATWVPLETVASTQNAWTEVAFQVEDFVSLTDEVRLRFVAEDDPNNSLVEAGVDDLSVVIYDADPRLSLFGSPEIGTPIAMHVTGEAGDVYSVFASTGTASINLPGVQGTILIDPGPMFKVTKGTIPAIGTARQVPALPNQPSLVGKTFYMQALLVGGSLRLSNREQLTFE